MGASTGFYPEPGLVDGPAIAGQWRPGFPVMKRLLILVGALAATSAALALALLLGSWALNTHRYIEHQDRLRRVLVQQPTMERVVKALEDEGSPLIAAPATAEEIETVIAERGGAKAAELRAKARRWPRLRVFRAADMVYFIYFDGEGIMRDFTCVSR